MDTVVGDKVIINVFADPFFKLTSIFAIIDRQKPFHSVKKWKDKQLFTLVLSSAKIKG